MTSTLRASAGRTEHALLLSPEPSALDWPAKRFVVSMYRPSREVCAAVRRRCGQAPPGVTLLLPRTLFRAAISLSCTTCGSSSTASATRIPNRPLHSNHSFPPRLTLCSWRCSPRSRRSAPAIQDALRDPARHAATATREPCPRSPSGPRRSSAPPTRLTINAGAASHPTRRRVRRAPLAVPRRPARGAYAAPGGGSPAVVPRRLGSTRRCRLW
jgi:hypothetical protein